MNKSTLTNGAGGRESPAVINPNTPTSSLRGALALWAALLLLLRSLLITGDAQEAPGTNETRWLDPALMGEVTNILGKVEQRLERLNAMTNNAVVDQVLDSAKAELDQLVKVQVPKMVAGVSNALKVNQRGLETARTNAGDTTKPAEYIEKWSRLRDRWQRVLRSLDLQSDEVRGIHADLVKLARTLDEEREYLRELIKVGEAEALSEDLASFIKALASLRDRVAQTLGPAPQKEPGPRPQISSN